MLRLAGIRLTVHGVPRPGAVLLFGPYFLLGGPYLLHLKGHVALDGDGRLQARVLPGQESFRIAPLAHSNAWIVVDAAGGDLQDGALVEVYPPGHLLGLQLQGQD